MELNTARKLYERRFRASPIVTTGELIGLIGSDSIKEALDKRWIVPDTDTGMLTLNFNGNKLVELESACRCRCGSLDCACPPQAAPALSTAMPAAMRESFAGFGLPIPSTPTGGPAPIMPRPQAPTTPAPSGPKAAPKIGDDAMVADQGKDYTGKVASVAQDGRMRLSFSQNKPPMDREYGPNEVRSLDQTPA